MNVARNTYIVSLMITTLLGCKSVYHAGLSADDADITPRDPVEDAALIKEFLSIGASIIPSGGSGHSMMEKFYFFPRSTGFTWDLIKANKKLPDKDVLLHAYDGLEIFAATAKQYFHALHAHRGVAYIKGGFRASVVDLSNARLTLLPTVHMDAQGRPVCISTTLRVSQIQTEDIPEINHLPGTGGEKNALESYLVRPTVNADVAERYYHQDFLATVFNNSDTAHSQLAFLSMYSTNTPDLEGLMEGGGRFDCNAESCTLLKGAPLESPDNCPVMTIQ